MTIEELMQISLERSDRFGTDGLSDMVYRSNHLG